MRFLKKVFFILLFILAVLISVTYVFQLPIPGDIKKVFGGIIAALCMILLPSMNFLWPREDVSPGSLNDVATDMKKVAEAIDESALEKYRVEPYSESGRKKIRWLTILWVFIITGVCSFLLFSPHFFEQGFFQWSYYIFPFNIWSWTLFGVIFILSSFWIRNIYTKPTLFFFGLSIEFSSWTVAFLWQQFSLPMLYFNYAISLIIVIIMAPFLIVFHRRYLRRYLMRNFVGKVFELKYPIKSLLFSVSLVEQEHIGYVILQGLGVIVVSDNLSLPVGSTIKVVDITQNNLYLIIEKV
ncbi:MAG TPA: hypothetical protein VGV92_07165 [Gammaproteobacteria bacterium]|nr:hypothetical protein [Gammaproteobacteria bacterium]